MRKNLHCLLKKIKDVPHHYVRPSKCKVNQRKKPEAVLAWMPRTFNTYQIARHLMELRWIKMLREGDLHLRTLIRLAITAPIVLQFENQGFRFEPMQSLCVANSGGPRNSCATDLILLIVMSTELCNPTIKSRNMSNMLTIQ